MFSLSIPLHSCAAFLLGTTKKGTRVISAYTDGVFPHKAALPSTKDKKKKNHTEGDNTNHKRWNCET
jgi:hypothetical protein